MKGMTAHDTKHIAGLHWQRDGILETFRIELVDGSEWGRDGYTGQGLMQPWATTNQHFVWRSYHAQMN